MHTSKRGFISGDHWNVCERCGFDVRNSNTLQECNGLKVCKKCWEPRHPRDFVRARQETITAQGLVTGEPVGSDRRYGVSVGDTDLTLVYNVDSVLQHYDTTLTANRTVNLPSSAKYLHIFRITRTAGGAFNIDVGGIHTLSTVNTYVEVQFNGLTWEVYKSGSI